MSAYTPAEGESCTTGTAARWLIVVCLYALSAAAALPQAAPAQGAPQSVQLQVEEPVIDLSHPEAVTLHLRLVNSSQSIFRVSSRTTSLLQATNDNQASPCADLPNTAARPDALPAIVRAGATYSETVTLNTDVCKALGHAQALKVQRALLTADGSQIIAESALVPVQIAASPSTALRALLMQQAADWNRGDLDAFASGYKNSPDILFLGSTIRRGYEGMLAGYKQAYPTREAMGTLTFTDLDVQPLDPRFATVTGRFHLERTAHGGGNADGSFLLVVENTSSGWKIVRDDTTALPVPADRTPARSASHPGGASQP